jgi:3-hydroxybutyryl-CoA dehydrogenase
MSISTVRRFGVVGAGQMGRGIAQVAAAAGFEVILTDVTLAFAEGGKNKIAQALGKQVDKGKMKPEDRVALLDRIEAREGLAELSRADIAVEAITENLDIKLRTFRDADAALPKDAILASNTSSISITRLAASDEATRSRDRHALHEPRPAHEARGGRPRDPDIGRHLRSRRDLSLKLGKTVIGSKDRPGFIVNRMLVPFLNEACFALEEGLGSAADLDAGARLGLNHPMGPLELADLIGLDTLLFIGGPPPRVRRLQVPPRDAAPEPRRRRLARPRRPAAASTSTTRWALKTGSRLRGVRSTRAPPILRSPDLSCRTSKKSAPGDRR